MSPGFSAAIHCRILPAGFLCPPRTVAYPDWSHAARCLRSLSDGSRILILGGAGLLLGLLLLGRGAGLLLGLLLLGLNWQIFRAFEGYPLAERKRSKLLKPVSAPLLRLQRRRFDCLVAIRDDVKGDDVNRANAAWRLDREFPPNRAQLLPTRFGNAVMAFETAAMP